MRFVDAIGIGLILLGLLMTIHLYTARFYGPSIEMRDLQIQEIPNSPQPAPQVPFDRIRS